MITTRSYLINIRPISFRNEVSALAAPRFGLKRSREIKRDLERSREIKRDLERFREIKRDQERSRDIKSYNIYIYQY